MPGRVADPVSSPRNPRLRAVRAVRAGRDRRHLLLEGPRLLADALAAGVHPLWVLHDPGRELPADLLEEARRRGAEVLPCPGHLLERESDLDSPRGLLAMAPRPRGSLGEVLAATAVAPGGAGLLLVAGGVQEPGNTGALVRVAAGLGAAAFLALEGGAAPWHPRAVRASAGAVFRLPVAGPVPPAAFLAGVREHGIALWAAVAGGDDPRRPPRRRPVALLLGSEGQGLAPELLAAAERRVGLPLARGVESLNVATAGAVLAWILLQGGGE